MSGGAAGHPAPEAGPGPASGPASGPGPAPEASGARPGGRSSGWPPPPEPYSAFATVEGLGGVAAPLLAGFAVTLIALVAQIAPALRHPDAALLLFAASAVLFLQVVQLNARARGYAVTPGQVREWYPDADDPERHRVLAWELRHHRDCWAYLVRRTRLRYNVAILALAVGLMVMLIPTGGLGLARAAAIAVLGLFTLVEILELVDQALHGRPGGRIVSTLGRFARAVAPSDPPVPRPPFPDAD
ncbi:hypothetical protein WEI85_25815 [Actinomycetes bacterium KLBMP 9797]